CRSRRPDIRCVEHRIEVQPTKLSDSAAPLNDIALGIDRLDVSRADPYLWLVLDISHLSGDTLRQHHIIRAKWRDQISLSSSNAIIQRSGKALIGLSTKIKLVSLLQALNSLDAVILRTIVHDQQLNIWICLLQNAQNALFDVRPVVVRGDNHRYEWEIEITHGSAFHCSAFLRADLGTACENPQ